MDPEQDKKLAHLLALAQEGDRQAYEEFLLQAAARLRGFLQKRMGPGPDVEDVLQDALLAIHRGRHSHTPGRPVGPWLYAIAEHRMIDAARRWKRSRRLQAALAQELGRPEVERENTSALAELLKRLPAKQKNVIEMLKLQELSVAEVADRTGMSKSAVKVSSFRGHQTLRRLLAKEKK